MTTKTKRQVTLLDTTISALESEGLGSLSVGIELLFRDKSRGPAHHAKPHTRTSELPDDAPVIVVDPRNPTKHRGTVSRLAREDAIEQKKLDNLRQGFKNICVDIFIGAIPKAHLSLYMADYATNLTTDDMWDIYEEVKEDKDGSSAEAKAYYWTTLNTLEAERAAEAANHKMMLAVGLTSAEIRTKTQAPQTMRLSTKALRGLSLFGTPESMTDEQIAEINADWESKPLADYDENIT